MRGRYLVMRYSERRSWPGQYISIAGRTESLPDALALAGQLRRAGGAALWIAAARLPATLSAQQQRELRHGSSVSGGAAGG